MGLPPLEYIDCFLDSPNFRDVITLYEKELDGNAVLVKSLVKECRRMIQATEGQRIVMYHCLLRQVCTYR